MFSRNDEIIRKFGEMINAGRIIVNSPGSIGAIGGIYNDMVPTFSFGCGTGGGNSTTDNVNVYHYLNIKRVARRTQAPMWLRIPNQIYFNLNAVDTLRQFPSRSTIIVTNPVLEQIGHVDIVRRHLPPQTSRPCHGHSRCRARAQGRHARRGGAQDFTKRTRSSRWAADP